MSQPLTTFHIRAPLPRKGGNQFYLDNAPRVAKTLCGEPVTSHDIYYAWQAFAVGNYEPCERCVEIRRESKSTRIRRLAHTEPPRRKGRG